MKAINYIVECGYHTFESFCTFNDDYEKEFNEQIEALKVLSDLSSEEVDGVDQFDHKYNEYWEKISGWAKYDFESVISGIRFTVWDVKPLDNY